MKTSKSLLCENCGHLVPQIDEFGQENDHCPYCGYILISLEEKEKTMINFKEHDGLLFKMLDKPVPLTPDAKFPCVVRLIQDDSPMGRYNQSYSEYRYGVRLGCCMLPIIATHIAKNGVVNDIEWDVSRYEIIGYHVAEGSKEWALYQMMQGEKVCHEKSQSIMYCEHAGYIRREVRYNCVDHMSVSVWLDGADNTGWQIYVEPEQPKPKYQVGDWVEIESSHVKGKTFVSVIKEMPNQEHYTVQVNSFFGRYTVFGVMERQIIRKLKPSEIVVKIGCLSGTIGKSCEPACFLMWHSNPKMDFNYSIIRFSALDTQTRELVEGLLKAQDEEK